MTAEKADNQKSLWYGRSSFSYFQIRTLAFETDEGVKCHSFSTLIKLKLEKISTLSKYQNLSQALERLTEVSGTPQSVNSDVKLLAMETQIDSRYLYMNKSRTRGLLPDFYLTQVLGEHECHCVNLSYD